MKGSVVRVARVTTTLWRSNECPLLAESGHTRFILHDMICSTIAS